MAAPIHEMDQYEKTKSEEVLDSVTIPGIMDSTPNMKVTDNSKIKNLLGYVMKKIQSDGVRQILWTAHGEAVAKAISCAEIMKRRVDEPLHQITDVRYKRFVDIWEPKDKDSELDTLKVNRDVPSVAILMSMEPLDVTHPGYQPPGNFEKFWKDKVDKDSKKQAKLVEESKEIATNNLLEKMGQVTNPESMSKVLAKKAKKKQLQKQILERKQQYEGKPDDKKGKKRLPKSQRPKSYVSIDNTAMDLHRQEQQQQKHQEQEQQQKQQQQIIQAQQQQKMQQQQQQQLRQNVEMIQAFDVGVPGDTEMEMDHAFGPYPTDYGQYQEYPPPGIDNPEFQGPGFENPEFQGPAFGRFDGTSRGGFQQQDFGPRDFNQPFRGPRWRGDNSNRFRGPRSQRPPKFRGRGPRNEGPRFRPSGP